MWCHRDAQLLLRKDGKDRKDYLHWQLINKVRPPDPDPPLPFLSQLNRVFRAKPPSTPATNRRSEKLETHCWSTKVNLPSIAQRVTNWVVLTWTSLGDGGEMWGWRRHIVTRQFRLEVSLSPASPSGSSWLLGQLRIYPVQWRVQYLYESVWRKHTCFLNFFLTKRHLRLKNYTQ